MKVAKGFEVGEDVVRVLDAFKLDHAVLAGHSVAGEELTVLGAPKSSRIAALVYLDAAWDRTYSAPKGPTGAEDCAGKMGIASQPKTVDARFDPAQAIRNNVQKPDYAQIHIPALAFYAAPRSWEELVPGAPALAPEKRACAEQMVAGFTRTRKHMEEEFQADVLGSRVVDLPGGGHYVFRTNEADVLSGMRSFLESLP